MMSQNERDNIVKNKTPHVKAMNDRHLNGIDPASYTVQLFVACSLRLKFSEWVEATFSGQD